MIRKSGVALLFLFLFFPLLGNAASVVTLDSRPGVQQKFLVIETKQPIAERTSHTIPVANIKKKNLKNAKQNQ